MLKLVMLAALLEVAVRSVALEVFADFPEMAVRFLGPVVSVEVVWSVVV